MAAGTYGTTHDVKVSFCNPDFSRREKKSHRFHVDNYEGESGIGYGIILGPELMVYLVMMVDLKCNVLQWYSAAVPTKETNSLLDFFNKV